MPIEIIMTQKLLSTILPTYNAKKKKKKKNSILMLK